MEYKLDGGDYHEVTGTPAFSGTVTLRSLATGQHTFDVRSIAPDGTADATPATRTFTVGP
jgi:hypothetical protein